MNKFELKLMIASVVVLVVGAVIFAGAKLVLYLMTLPISSTIWIMLITYLYLLFNNERMANKLYKIEQKNNRLKKIREEV